MDTGSWTRTRAGLITAAKWTYVILGVALIFYISYFIYNVMQRPITGILFFMAGVLALYFYYVKWFIVPAVARASWPPTQTICPDYLTPITPGYNTTTDASGRVVAAPVDNNGNKFKCVDFVGVSKNGYLRRATPAALQQQIVDPRYYFEVDPKESPADLRLRLQSYGLSWVSLFGDD